LVAAALTQHEVVVPHFHGRRGHPVGFGAECGAALARLAGEQGAAPVVRACAAAGRVHSLELEDPGIVTDIDTIEDLMRAERELNGTTHP
jgi:molybdenum cofactor cytidylyltransferase